MNGILYIVGTPIGHLEDITLRALAVLKQADLILCEDTRVTKKLLAKYEIATSTLSYHEHSGMMKTEKIITLLEEGKTLALVSDAGTPAISDPGARLVAAVRTELPDAQVIPIPGASAVVAALSASGFPSDQFLFLGFLPHKKGRETLFKEITASERTVAFYESPHRLLKTLESLKKHLPENRRIAVARELTKMFESIKIGTSLEVAQYYADHPDEVRGEIVILVEG